MKAGANTYQKTEGLALCFLIIWQKYYLLSQENNFHKSTGLVFGKTLFHTLMLFKRLLQMAGKKVWKQQHTETKESIEVSKNIYAILTT